MPHFGPIQRRDFIKCLTKAGFDGPFPGGKHEFMVRPGDKLRLIVPNPHRGEISRLFLAELLQQAGISREEWENL